MPKYIREFKIDKSNIIGSTTKQLTVIGDRGAVFNMHVVRGNSNYYNFETRAFTSTFTSENTLTNATLTGSSYTTTVTLPANTDGDTYTFQLFPQPHFDTELSESMRTEYTEGSGDTLRTKSLFNKYYYETKITQSAQTQITITLASKAHSSKYNSFGSDAENIVITGYPGSKVSTTSSINWKVTATDADNSCGFTVVTQPIERHFESSKTSSLGGTAYKVKGIRTAEKKVKLDTIEDLTIGDTITNNYSGATIPTIVHIDYENNEIELDVVQTLVDKTALTLTAKGESSIDSYSRGLIKFQNLKVQTADEYDGFNIKTSASHSGTGAIDIDDTLGLVLGLKVTGVELGTEATITAINRSGNTVTLGSASYTLKDNAILKVTGGANEATITGDILVTKFPEENTTITLDLDKILLPKGTT